MGAQALLQLMYMNLCCCTDLMVHEECVYDCLAYIHMAMAAAGVLRGHGACTARSGCTYPFLRGSDARRCTKVCTAISVLRTRQLAAPVICEYICYASRRAPADFQLVHVGMPLTVPFFIHALVSSTKPIFFQRSKKIYSEFRGTSVLSSIPACALARIRLGRQRKLPAQNRHPLSIGSAREN